MAKNMTFPIFEIVEGVVTPVLNPVAVEFWSTGEDAQKIFDLNGGIINNGDGTYTIDKTDLPSGVYQVKIDYGSGLMEPPEFNNIHIIGNDVLLRVDADGVSLEFDTNLHVAPEGIRKTHLNSDIIGTGLKREVGGALAVDIDDTAGDGDTTKVYSADKIVELLGQKAAQTDMAAAQTAIETLEDAVALSFASEIILDQSRSISQNLERLQSAINTLRSSQSEYHLIYSDRVTDTTPSGTLSLPEYAINPNNPSYVDAVAFAYMKQAGISTVKLVFEAQYSDIPNTFGYVRLYFNSGISVEKQIIYATSYWARFEVYLDIDEIDPTSIMIVKVQVKNPDSAVELIIRNIQIYTY